MLKEKTFSLVRAPRPNKQSVCRFMELSHRVHAGKIKRKDNNAEDRNDWLQTIRHSKFVSYAKCSNTSICFKEKTPKQSGAKGTKEVQSWPACNICWCLPCYAERGKCSRCWTADLSNACLYTMSRDKICRSRLILAPSSSIITF